MTHQESQGPEASKGPSSPPQLDGSREIGPYKLLSVLGEGGMGIVYLAEQTSPLRRRVAVKVLKLGMDTEQVVARFESERQALAVMDHPSIAKVLDSGVTASGRPYFVMGVVHGVPITQYSDTHRLTTAERLRLFIEVCSAVQHAHTKGVIHRDLKPSNVLVAAGESGPVARVIDFGIAKAVGIGFTERTLVTQAGQMIGTPEYMSPEQAEMSGLDVDTRTDIYSLGVMLYELVVGVRPFDFPARPGYAISHTIREKDVPRPSTKLTTLGETLPTIARHRRTTPDSLRRELRGDLDWIILKAMDKDRTRRYETANGLALDLQRYLADEPVRARPPSAGYRVRKFARRNRGAVLAASIVLVAVLGGAASTAVGFVRAVHEQERAERAAAIAQQTAGFLADLFEATDPAEAAGNVVTARDLLDRGAERVRSELDGQPAVQAELLRTIGIAYSRLGHYDLALPLLEQAVRLGEQDPVRDDAELALTLQRLGIAYRRQERMEEAERALQRARDLGRRSLGPGSAELLGITNSLGGLYIALGRSDEAAVLLAEVATMQEELLGYDHPDLATTLHNLGTLHIRLWEAGEALPHLERARAIRERALGPDHPQTGRTLINLGAAHFLLGDYQGAERAGRRAREIIERSQGPEHIDMGSVWTNLGEVRWARGEHGQAEADLLRARQLKERTLGPEHRGLAPTYRALGNVYRDQGRLGEAEALYRQALDILERSGWPEDPLIRETLLDLAVLLRLAERDEEAAEAEQQAARTDAAAPGAATRRHR